MDMAAIERALQGAGLQVPEVVRVALLDEADVRARSVPPWVVGEAFGAESIVIYPQRIGAYPYDSLESVVTHEIAHLALSARAGGLPLPRWFHEGVATSVESRWELGTELRLLLAAHQDPAIEDVAWLFTSDSQPATTTAYLLSTVLIDDVRRRHGAAVPGEIAARVADGSSFDEAFMAVTGETPDRSAALAWRMYRRFRWLPVLTSPSAVWGVILALSGVAFVARMRARRAKRAQWDEEERSSDNLSG